MAKKDNKKGGHQHHESMHLYAQDAESFLEPWKRWEVKFANGNKWLDLQSHPHWEESNEYRRKKFTISVLGHHFSEPLVHLPKEPDTFFIPSFNPDNDFYEDVFIDHPDDYEERPLSTMFISEHDAAESARVLMKIQEAIVNGRFREVGNSLTLFFEE